MIEDRVAKLTNRQKECLRLVYRRLGSKEIARELGLSHHTVNDHIGAALQALSAADRHEAARLLVQFEHPEWLMHEPFGIPPAPLSGPSICSPATDVDGQDDGRQDVVREEHSTYTAHPAPPSAAGPAAATRNQLDASERLRRIGTTSTKIVTLVAGTLLALVLLQKAAHGVFALIR